MCAMGRLHCLRKSRVCRTAACVFAGVFLLQVYHELRITAIMSQQERYIGQQSQNLRVQDSAPLSPAKNLAALAQNLSGYALNKTKNDLAKNGTIFGFNTSGAACGKMKRPSKNWSVVVDNWHALGAQPAYVYSAFSDRRASKPVVKVLFVASAHHTPTYYCHFWYKGEFKPHVVKGTLTRISEGSTYGYHSHWLLCDLSGSEEPEALSLSGQNCGESLADIPVHALAGRKQQHEFMVCICGPVKFGYSDSSQFMEWIEVNSLFGAEKFVAYNHSANSSLLPYAQHFSSAGRLAWLPWDLPLTRKDIKNFAHMALLNDCLYRTMYTAKYVAFLDLDEIIVPKKNHKNWLQVMETGKCLSKGSTNFKNVFFKLEWEDDEVNAKNDTISALKLKSLLKTKREKKVWPHRSRSKYIARPELLLEAGVHTPHKYVSGQSTCDVSDAEAWVQHYRWWDDPKPGWIEDKTLLRFTDEIITRVQSVLKSVSAH